jgi:hypothetical protein
VRHRAVLAFLLLPLLPGAAEGPPPVIDIPRLEQVKPGWAVAEATGDSTKGSLSVERVVWPMFYLHWSPRDAKAGEVTIPEAEALVTSLWGDKPVDGPLKSRAVSLPAHPGVEVETTRGHGEWKSRAFVWACPQSGRLLVADTNQNLTVSAPESLMGMQSDMARTVKCHPGAEVESFGHLGRTFDIPGSALSYAHHEEWLPVESYRRVTSFGQAQWDANTPNNTPELGQSVALEGDPFKRLFVSWGPTPDYPMSYDVLKQKIEDHWRERAADMLLRTGSVINEYWYMNGIMRPGTHARPYPPTRMHKFRTWMWRRGETTWFAVADVGGLRFGRSNPALPFDTYELKLEEMFQAIREPAGPHDASPAPAP